MPDVGLSELLIIALIMAFWVTAIILAVLGFRWLLRATGSGLHADQLSRKDPALAVLRERYARGEIDAAEFEERRRTLGA